jgi:hypothetical protein
MVKSDAGARWRGAWRVRRRVKAATPSVARRGRSDAGRRAVGPSRGNLAGDCLGRTKTFRFCLSQGFGAAVEWPPRFRTRNDGD